MNESLSSWLLLAVVVYIGYRLMKQDRPRFGVLQGGLSGPLPQFQPTQAPEPATPGGTPHVAVLAWPGADCCKC